MKDAFDNELKEGDFVVYAVGQGRAAGGLRIGRVTPKTTADRPVFTSIEKHSHYEFDNPDEVAYDYMGNESREGNYTNKPESPQNTYRNREYRKTHRVDDKYTEESARRIKDFKQVKKIFSIDEIANPMLKEFMESL